MNWIISLLQLFAYIILYLPVRFFFRVNSVYMFNNFNKGIILTPNHQSKLDVFLIFAAIPPRLCLRMLPIRSLVAYKYMDNWWKKLILTCFGNYPLKSGPQGGSQALLHILDLITKGRTILLFPEGKIVKNGETCKANPGIGYLALKKNVHVLPIYLSGFRNVSIKNLLLRKYHVKIVIGEPKHFYNQKQYSPQAISDRVLNDIYGLGNR